MSLVNDEIKKIIQKYVDEIVRNSKDKAPVKTGKLRDSYGSQVVEDFDNRYSVAIEAEFYHKFINDGTTKIVANPYQDNYIQNTRTGFELELQQKFAEEIEKIFIEKIKSDPKVFKQTK